MQGFEEKLLLFYDREICTVSHIQCGLAMTHVVLLLYAVITSRAPLHEENPFRENLCVHFNGCSVDLPPFPVPRQLSGASDTECCNMGVVLHVPGGM